MHIFLALPDTDSDKLQFFDSLALTFSYHLLVVVLVVFKYY